MPDEELERILSSVPPLSDTTELPGLEDILSEYRASHHAAAPSLEQEPPKIPEPELKSPPIPEPVPEPAPVPEPEPILFIDEDTGDIKKRARQMQEYAREVQARRPDAAPAEEKPELFEFSLGPEFDEHFAPSNEFIMPDASEHHFPEEEKKPGGFKAFLQRLKRAQDEPAPTLPQAHARAHRYAVNLRLRAITAFVLLLPLAFISCGQTWSFLPKFLSYSADGKPYLTLFFMVLFQFLVMLCGIDILGRGVSDLLHLRPGAETLVALSCLATLMQVGSIVLRNTQSEGSVLFNTAGFLPYCAVSAASVFFALWGASHRQAAYARSYKTAASQGAECDCVVSEERLWSGMPGFSRSRAKLDGFVTQAEAPDITSRVMRFFTPLLIVAFIALGILAASYHNEASSPLAGDGVQKQQYFFYIFAALCCAGVPMTTFGAFSYVYSRIAARLSHMGSAITGWTGAVEMSRGELLILSDGDLFPPGTMALNGLKILGDHSFETIISLSASLLYASGSGLFRALESVVKDQSGYLRSVTGLEAFEGGISGNIGGDRVMVGTLNFMHSMGIQVPSDLSSKSAVFTAVNHDLAGVLAVSYTPASQVKGALLLLEQQKMVNVLAVRDINISPALLRDKFGIDPDLPEYPVVEERVALSDPERPFHGKVSAILAREGLCPYAEAVIGGQRLHKFTLINLGVHLISLILGMLLVFYFACQTQPVAAATISPANLLIFMFIWWVVQWLVSCFSHRY